MSSFSVTGMAASYEVGDCFSAGQVTYRVVQVTQDGSEATAQVVSTGFPPGSQVAQVSWFIFLQFAYISFLLCI